MFKPKELDPDHRVTGVSPERAWVIEHQHNHQRDQFAEQFRTITQLRPVDAAISGCTAMNQLVAQGVLASLINQTKAKPTEKVMLVPDDYTASSKGRKLVINSALRRSALGEPNVT